MFHSFKPKVGAVIQLEGVYTIESFHNCFIEKIMLSEALCLALQFLETSTRPSIVPNGSQGHGFSISAS